MPKDGRGWHREPARHGLAARGVKTGRKSPTPKARKSMDKLAQKLAGEIQLERDLRRFIKDMGDAKEEAKEKWEVYRRTRGRHKTLTLEKAHKAQDEVAQAERIVQNVYEKIDEQSDLPKPHMEISRLEQGRGPGMQKLYRFKNGWGASVIMNPHSWGGDNALWELALIKWKTDDWKISDWQVSQRFPQWRDSKGNLNDAQVAQELRIIGGLKEYAD